jgi:hypothetical protein
MKNVKLYFEVELDYQTKLFKPLAELGSRTYDVVLKKYRWYFPVSNAHKVLAIIGRPMIFSSTDALLVSQYSKHTKATILRGQAYGTGFVNVQLASDKPNYFLVTTVRERQPQNTYVSFDTVAALWKVLLRQPLNKKMHTGTVAENYCQELGIVDFNTYKNEAFNWKYFSGSRRHYLVFYSAIKVLAHYGVAEHIVEASNSGIKRTNNTWSIQTELSIGGQ